MKFVLLAAPVLAAAMVVAPAQAGTQSVARQWNDELLEAIRHDLARPTVHARNLYHSSVAMWDAWAMYNPNADAVLTTETAVGSQADIEETLSFAVYRILRARFAKSPGAATTLPALDQQMLDLGYDKEFESTVGMTPAARGNRIAVNILYFGLNDNSNEAGGYDNLFYEPVNEPLVPALPGNPDLTDPNRWQPLALDFFVDQGGNVILGGYPDALGPEWGTVTPFSLVADDLTIYERDGNDYWVYHDPGDPPHLGGVGDDYYKWGNEMVVAWSSHLDPADGVEIDISPASIGNSATPDPGDWAAYYDFENGGDWGEGWDMNPVTGLAYTPQVVPRADYARALAEFWADGPDSETPPGHWFTLLNYVSDHPLTVKQFGGEGPVLDDLEWDVKMYLAMGGAMHDTAISAWGIKGWYDYIRPVSAIRHMCDNGQCSDPFAPSYHVDGINLHPDLIELVTADTTMPGEKHAHLAGAEGKIAIKAWRGPDYINNPDLDVAGVGWILADNWWPYQRPSFVTPPFPGYVSGHSTYSRCAALLMGMLTGSPYFPGGLGEFVCTQNEFLVFEDGPSETITLQWASYVDASDQTSLSRIWGGIHPPADDLPGRIIGEALAPDAFFHAVKYFNGQFSCPADSNGDGTIGVDDLVKVFVEWGTDNPIADYNGDGIVDVNDMIQVFTDWGPCS